MSCKNAIPENTFAAMRIHRVFGTSDVSELPITGNCFPNMVQLPAPENVTIEQIAADGTDATIEVAWTISTSSHYAYLIQYRVDAGAWSTGVVVDKESLSFEFEVTDVSTLVLIGIRIKALGLNGTDSDLAVSDDINVYPEFELDGDFDYEATATDAVQRSVVVSPDKSKMYLVNEDDIIEYDLTDGDPTTAAVNATYDLAAEGITTSPFAISEDGSTLFTLISNTHVQVSEFSVAFDVSSLGILGSNAISLPSSPTGIWVNSAGTRAFVCNATSIKSYTLAGFTGSWTLAETYNITVDNQCQGIWSEGTKLWIVGDQNDRIYEFNLTSAGVLTGMTLFKTHQMPTPNPHGGLCVRDNDFFINRPVNISRYFAFIS